MAERHSGSIVEKRLESWTAILDFGAVAGDPGSWMFVDDSGLVTRLDLAADRPRRSAGSTCLPTGQALR